MSNKEIYQSDIALQQRLPLFFKSWWLDIVCSNWDVALVGKNNSITAVFPYTVEQKLGIKIIRNPPLTPFLGPHFLDTENLSSFKRINKEEQIFEKLWQQLPLWDSLDCTSTTSFDNFLLFLHKGFEAKCRITYQIDLSQSADTLFANIQSSHRKRIEQTRENYSIDTGVGYIPNMLDLHEQTFKRKDKKYPYSSKLLSNIILKCEEQKAGKLLVAKDIENNVMGSVFIAWDNVQAYLLLSAVDVAKAHKGTICLLIWRAIVEAQKQNLSIFDFEGSIDAGIEPFFRRFGGERKNFYQFSANKSNIWKIKKALLG